MDTKTGGTENAAQFWLASSSDEVAPSSKKVIPPGTKVFFRWVNRTDVWASSVETHKKLLRHMQQNGRRDEARSDSNENGMAPSPDGVDFFEPPLHSNADGLFSAVIVLLSLIGLVLVFLLGYFLVRFFHGGDGDDDENSLRREEESPKHRHELRVVLVPKNGRRKSSLPSALIHPFGLGDKKHLIERKATVAEFGHQPTNGATRPFPKRIYELQAEEGYFSCPPSMRASFELD
ncbi:hypothetical protein niasHT_003843 [Heterodera trifolii]|uniref:Uncharacterized protein n=1 Tax=Heterodera trifolii TaxID=157864 RepID=A0ABD2LUZ3_9BILA